MAVVFIKKHDGDYKKVLDALVNDLVGSELKKSVYLHTPQPVRTHRYNISNGYDTIWDVRIARMDHLKEAVDAGYTQIQYVEDNGLWKRLMGLHVPIGAMGEIKEIVLNSLNSLITAAVANPLSIVFKYNGCSPKEINMLNHAMFYLMKTGYEKRMLSMPVL